MATTTITCTQCNYVNEGERIYCHGCGAKLDRSVLPEEKKNVETTEQQHRRVKKMTSPTRGMFAGYFKTALSALIFAAFVAMLVQMARPPADVPPVPRENN